MSLTEMADTEMPDADCQSAVILYNPYEGQVCARQLGETVEDFLRRLPPSTTPSITTAGPGAGVPWIYIANPFLKRPTIHSEYKQHELANEGPPDEKSDWAQYVVRGGNILAELTSIKNEIEKERAGQAKASITRTVNFQKETIVQKLLDTAAELHCTSGKVRRSCPPKLSNTHQLHSGCCFVKLMRLTLFGIWLLVLQLPTSSE
jgi:hypothetical protein